MVDNLTELWKNISIEVGGKCSNGYAVNRGVWFTKVKVHSVLLIYMCVCVWNWIVEFLYDELI